MFVFRSESHVCYYICKLWGLQAKNYSIEEIVGVTGSSNLVVKAQLVRIGITKFIAIATPGYDNYRKFYYSHYFYYFKQTIIMY